MFIRTAVFSTLTATLFLTANNLAAVPKPGGAPLTSKEIQPNTKTPGNANLAPDVVFEMISCASGISIANCLLDTQPVTIEKTKAILGAQVELANFPIGSLVNVSLLNAQNQIIDSLQGLVEDDPKIGSHVIYALQGEEVKDGILLIQRVLSSPISESSETSASTTNAFAAVKINVGNQAGINIGNGLQQNDDPMMKINTIQGQSGASASGGGCALKTQAEKSTSSTILLFIFFGALLSVTIFSRRKVEKLERQDQ